jgi:hypothetical protein
MGASAAFATSIAVAIMKRFVAVALLAACASDGTSDSVAGRTAYVGGQVFDGQAFVAKDLVVEDGRIIDAAASTAAERGR